MFKFPSKSEFMKQLSMALKNAVAYNVIYTLVAPNQILAALPIKTGNHSWSECNTCLICYGNNTNIILHYGGLLCYWTMWIDEYDLSYALVPKSSALEKVKCWRAFRLTFSTVMLNINMFQIDPLILSSQDIRLAIICLFKKKKNLKDYPGNGSLL